MDARARLLHYWSLWITTQSSDDASTQCLIVKVGAEVSDVSEEMRQILESGTVMITDRITLAITDGQADGSITSDIKPQLLGPALYQMWLGASLMAKLAHKPKPLLQAMITTEMLLPDPRMTA
jgi:TetR/AcrR family transcriptional repressor of nem operon